MSKCACAMTTPELLAANTAGKLNLKAILIEDTGRHWTVTPYSSDAAGLGSTHITLQSALEEAERWMAVLRRSERPAYDPKAGIVVTDPHELSKALTK